MILLDTNVLIFTCDPDSPFHQWSREIIAAAVAGDGAAINAVTLAEICVGDVDPSTVADRLRSWGVVILDLPVAAAELCAAAYRRYLSRRQADTGNPAPRIPLPDFFIGAHALVMGWELATADHGRFKQCFPGLSLRTP